MTFACRPEHWGIIPEPYPAAQLLPDWYKKLKQRVHPFGTKDSTVKRCAPFLDALSAGFIIPLAADVEIFCEGDKITTSARIEEKVIGFHDQFQVGEDMPQPLKFSNFWQIQVPRGWSVLFVPPLNRPDSRFECFSGIVECDKYTNLIHFPFTLKEKAFSGIIEQGTPLVQAIPFKRKAVKATSRVMTEGEVRELHRWSAKLNAHSSHYRDYIWKKESKCPFRRLFGL